MNILSGLFRKKFEKDDTKIPLYEDYNTEDDEDLDITPAYMLNPLG